MDELRFIVKTGSGEERGAAEAALRQSLVEVFPEASLTVETPQPARGAIRTRGSVVDVAELVFTLSMHAFLVWEIHKHQRANANTLANVRALLKALAQAGLAVDQVRVEVNGEFRPLSELLRRIGLSSDNDET